MGLIAAVFGSEVSLRLRDTLKHSEIVSRAGGVTKMIRGWVTPPGPRRLAALAGAYERVGMRWARRAISRKMRELADVPGATAIEASRRYPATRSKPRLNRGIILKAPAPNGEKGVLHLTPEYNWVKLLAIPEAVRNLTDRFDLWLTASWSPADYHLLFLALQHTRDVLFVSPGNHAETQALAEFDPRIRCVPTIASDWINPAHFQPRPWQDRTNDILMVANYSPYKRHWHFFSALRRMPKNLRVTMIGQPDGSYTLETIQRQAREMRAPQDIRFLQNVPTMAEVHAEMCNSRVSVITSRREGACVAVVESMFADTPVALLRYAQVGTTAYINEKTGTFLDGYNIGSQLMRFVEAADRYQPRAWAMANISFVHSIDKANQVFRDHAAAMGRPWTKDLAPFCWYPDPTYCRAEDREAFLSLYEDLQTRYRVGFGPEFCPRALGQPEGN